MKGDICALRRRGGNAVGVACVLGLILCVMAACTPARKEGLTLLFTGDVLLDRGVRPLAEEHGIPWLFEGVAPEFDRADAVVINLECPLADTLSPIGKQFSFRADVRWADGLREGGVTHACMANNHTNDQSRRGLRSTDRALRDAGIVPLGYGVTAAERVQPAVISKGAVTAAVFNTVAFTLENWVPASDQPDVCQLAPEALAAIVRDYKYAHPEHFVIAVLHWGNEFHEVPSMRQRLAATILVSAGCDAVIGHHPHVIQPVEFLRSATDGADVPVFYSLGNFVFDQSAPAARRAIMAELVLTPEGLTARSINVSIRRCRPYAVRAHRH